MRVRDMTMELEILEDHEDRDMVETQEPIETLHEKDFHKRKPTWEHEPIQYAERYDAPEGMHRETKRPKPYNNYVALLCDITEIEYSNYEEAAKKNGRMS